MESKGLKLVVDVAPPPLKGVGDPERLGRAIEQLLDNAAKFTPTGGTVLVRVGPLDEEEFEIRVADSGPGVPEEAKNRIFEPFFQADGSVTRSYGGAGVGLAVVRGVAVGHGGSVQLTSPANEVAEGQRLMGACFSVRFAKHARAALSRPR
jgi:signal transduction histidine kinase